MLKSFTIPAIAKSTHVDDSYPLNDFIDSLIVRGKFCHKLSPGVGTRN
jgi:hypothetical protein